MNNIPPQLGLLFDLDGVLIDSGPQHHAAWQRFAADHGVPFSDAFFAETFGMPNRAILPRLLNRSLADDELEALSEEKEARYREIAATELAFLPGAEVLLAELAADPTFRVGLFTSTPASNYRFIDARLGLSRYLDVALNGSEVPNGKPAPDGYLELARRLGVSSSHAAVIEDAPAGISAGQAGGFTVIGVASTHAAETIATADLVVEGVNQLSLPQLRALLT